MRGDGRRKFVSGRSPRGEHSEGADVDSFYSKFPSGSVGLALFLLRLADGFGLASEGIHLFSPAGTASEGASALLLGLVLAASAVMLILGLRTSVAGSAAAVSTAGSAVYDMQS